MVFKQLTLDQVNRACITLDGAAGKSVNVAKVLHALGAEPFATGFLGGIRGEQLRQKLEGIPLDFVIVATPTRECVTVIDEATGKITELVEESRPVDPSDYQKLLVIFQKHIPQAQAVVMSGTIASGGPADLYFRCALLAHQAGVMSLVDASGLALMEALKASPGLVKPNRAELEATVGSELRGERALMNAMRELHARGAQRVVITAGSDPTLAFDGNHFWRVKAPQVSPLNPIGSGDAFTAGLAWRLTQGDGLAEACRWASAAGAANALTAMAGEVNRQDVERLAPAVQVEQI